MATKNKIEQALKSLQLNVNDEHMIKIMKHRKPDSATTKLSDKLLKAILQEEGLSEDSVEAINILLKLTYLEGYAKGEASQPELTKQKTIYKPDGLVSMFNKIKRS